MALTPELRQSVTMLQLTGHDLIRYLEEQSQENPLLDIEYRSDYVRPAGIGRAGAVSFDPLWHAATREETMEQELIRQLGCLSLQPSLLKAASYLAGNLDDRGYLDISLEEAGQRLNMADFLVERALQCLQSLEPAGIGARSFKECLLIQIRRDPRAHHLAEVIVQQHLKALAHGRLSSIAEDLGGVRQEQVAAALRYIQTLDPKPGIGYACHEPDYVVPDAIIERENGRFVIRMNNRYLPKVSLNAGYAALISSEGVSSYVKERVKSAEWIIRSLEQREHTITRVIEYIIHRQHGFLEHGDKLLRPMNLRQVAEHLQLHESTISRAVSNKFVKMPSGTYELKYFFTTGIQTEGGEEASSKTIKAQLRELVEREDKSCPISDQRLSELLLQQGFRISRRTVAKYRDELGILPSSMRKTFR